MSVIPAGGGEVVGDSPERRVEILCDDEALHATWSRFGPGRDGADLHVHRRHTDIFYVLEGELTVRLGLEDRQVTIPAGTFAVVPPLVVHGFRNASDADMRYLNFHAPGRGFADYMRALRDGRKLAYDQYDPPADGGRPASEALAGVPAVDIAAIRIAEVSGRPPHPGAYVYVLEGEQAGAWGALGADLAEPVRFLEIHAG
jgi:mannose-6-phosphate isomerase-like protein (cupin superfamily)